MREIKFRGICDDGEIVYPDGVLTGNRLNSGDILKRFSKVEQFTGLKDINGKEIYEGDIVKSLSEYNSYTGLNSKIYAGKNYEVKNNGWNFYLYPKSIYKVDLNQVKVIGNIHEDKDLL